MDYLGLLNLPLAIQLALASGYAAYLIAYRGIRYHHKAIDTAALTVVFSLAATGFILAMEGRPRAAVIVVTFLGTVAVGLVWRVVCINLFQAAIRHFNVSWADDTPSAWFALQANSRDRVSQIAVQLDDGTWLRCDDARQFDDAPFGPCILGTDGDVALYLTHEELPGQEAKELKTVRDSQWGDRLTYVPVGRIKRMTIRHKR